MSNRLAAASSPYLLQHQTNPVDWWPWCPEAFAEAQRLDRPVLLSVGYAACHWCHVMAHESFENEGIAALMNQFYINIKVDREERPDVDQLYMSALHALSEQGGWPLTMFLTPKAEPFWGGTYFPPTPRYGRPGFGQVLTEIARIWREDRNRISTGHAELLRHLSQPPDSGVATFDRALLDRAASRLLDVMDPIHGGPRGAPKFPQAPLLEVLARAGDRTGSSTFSDMVDLTLTKICRGGIYDHIGGGFARYSTDDHWLVPHFEKMLYDQAQLIELLTIAWQRSGVELFRARIEETIDWLKRDMLQPAGAFASSLDADSEGEEGKFYVWTPSEIEAVLGPADAALFCTAYDITPSGNWEGKAIPNRTHSRFGSSEEESRLADLKHQLRVSRETRVWPGLDDKILADWNALIISALARASAAFARSDWLALAINAYEFLTRSVSLDGRPGHAWRQGHMTFPGFASDAASLARAALDLFEATQNETYLTEAARHLDCLETHHRHPQLGLYTTAAQEATDLPLRMASTLDEATPNAHGLAITSQIRLSLLTGDQRYLARADELLARLAAATLGNVFAHASVLNALDLRLAAVQIVIVSPADHPRLPALRDHALRVAPYRRLLTIVTETDRLPPTHPAHGKKAAGSEPTAFVCVGERCSLPITDPQALILEEATVPVTA